jgi:hypothetical protein
MKLLLIVLLFCCACTAQPAKVVTDSSSSQQQSQHDLLTPQERADCDSIAVELRPPHCWQVSGPKVADCCVSPSGQHLEQLPDAPVLKTHERVLDPLNISMFWGDAVAVSSEVGASCTGQNALSRKDCKTLAVGATGFLTAEVLATFVAHKTGHHTLERLIPSGAVLFHIARFAYVTTHRRH